MVLIKKIQNLQQKKKVYYWQWIKRYYSDENEIIKFLTSSFESNLCDYSDAYLLVTGNINVTGSYANTKVAFKNCAPFRKCRREINETFVDYADFINIAMPMCNLIEYSDNYSGTSVNLWDFKRDEIVNNADVYVSLVKASLIGNTENNGTSMEY